MIQVTHLKKTYSNGLEVLRDVNATIQKGEVISIIGPSGTGKSTFLRCLNLLERPSGGSIVVDGQDLMSSKTNVPHLRQKMGMVFQNFNLFNHMYIKGNIPTLVAPWRQVCIYQPHTSGFKLYCRKDRAKRFNTILLCHSI